MRTYINDWNHDEPCGKKNAGAVNRFIDASNQNGCYTFLEGGKKGGRIYRAGVEPGR
jgi:hypothetical protein